MKSGITIGAGAGLVGGLVAAFILAILGIKGHEGQITRAIILVSPIVGSGSFVVGGLIQVAVATALGALFGVLYEAAGLGRESVAAWATFYAIAWWVVGWFAVMPRPLRFAPWEAVEDPALFQLAFAGLLACLGFGAALAGAFTLFGRAAASRRAARLQAARVAPPNGALNAGRR
jgi:hypothetical protein